MMFLDSCVLINLMATGRLEEIARHFPSKAAISPAVRKESIYLRNPPEAEEVRVRASVEPLLADGTLVEASLQTSDEKRLYVSLTMKMEDGAAMAMAIAICRSDYLATDDRAAAMVYAEAGGGGAKLRSTLDLLKAWEEAGCSVAEVGAALRFIHARARYRPALSHPLHTWWSARFSAAQ
jgi:predicted nucleic acid-binding protein